MSKSQSRRTGGRARSSRAGTRLTIDPFFACLIFAGVGLGTLGIATSPRLVVLWTTLVGLWLAYREGQTIRLRFGIDLRFINAADPQNRKRVSRAKQRDTWNIDLPANRSMRLECRM